MRLSPTALLVAFVALAFAAPAAAEDYPSTLQFKEFSPCPGSATYCWPRLLLYGEIDDGAADRLRPLLDKHQYGTVVFDSPGGNLAEGIRIGLLLRSRGTNTAVAPEYTQELPGTGEVDTIARDVVCASACAYAFMGGASRTLEDGARLGVHQFYGRDEPASGASAQVTTALLSQYMVAMGVDRELLDLASMTESDTMTYVGKADAARYNLDNQEPAEASWGIKALDDGTVVASIDQQQAGSDMSTRVLIQRLETSSGWLVGVTYGAIPESTKDMRNILASLDKRGPKFCNDSYECVSTDIVRAWSFDEKTRFVTGLFLVQPDPLIKIMASARWLELDAEFYKGDWSVDPNVKLGTKGLKSSLLAIVK